MEKLALGWDVLEKNDSIGGTKGKVVPTRREISQLAVGKENLALGSKEEERLAINSFGTKVLTSLTHKSTPRSKTASLESLPRYPFSPHNITSKGES